MVDAVTVVSSSPSRSRGESAGGRPPALDAQLEKCRGQLQDWVSCPSAKTPEGKAKIEEISAKVDVLEKKIKEADQRVERAARPTQPVPADPVASPASADGSAVSTLGSVVDIYA